jgi:hypothetical protein
LTCAYQSNRDLKCATCSEGYLIDSVASLCRPCSTLIENCLACKSLDTYRVSCTRCEDGYSLEGDWGSCESGGLAVGWIVLIVILVILVVSVISNFLVR